MWIFRGVLNYFSFFLNDFRTDSIKFRQSSCQHCSGLSAVLIFEDTDTKEQVETILNKIKKKGWSEILEG